MSHEEIPFKERYYEGDESFTPDYVKSLETQDERFWAAYAKALENDPLAKKE